MAWKVRVNGTPAPQGSMHCIGSRGGRGGHTLIPNNRKALDPWRTLVTLACKGIVQQGVTFGPGVAVDVDLTFYLPRPKSVRPAARPLPTVKPDVDKLERAVLDAMTMSGIVTDDAQITDTSKRKRYADDANPPGLVLIVDTVVV